MTEEEAGLTSALEGYTIGAQLGRGAMGEVYGARQVRLGRDVAIKRLPTGFAADPEVRGRFGAEAQVLASLDHPHVVPVYDFVEREDLCLLVMQALPGGTVWEWFTNEGVSMPTACAIALAACAGLDHAHGRNVLHRDVKPDNLMFDEHRQLKVTDFGIAAVLGGSGTLATESGEVIGTPAYMAPEQADGSAVGPAADVYAVATMLYELLTGRLPFSEDGEPMDLLRRRLSERPEPIQQIAPRVPHPIASVVMHGRERSPGDRPRTAEEFGVELATAAVESWGPSWLDQADVKLLAGGTLAAAATTPVARTGSGDPAGPVRGGTGADGRETLPPGSTGPNAPGARDTVGPGTPAGEGTPLPGEGVSPGEPAATDAAASLSEAASSVVRPTRTRQRRAGPDLSGLDPSDVVPVSKVLTPTRAPWGWIVTAIVSALLVLLVAFGGVGGDGSNADATPTGMVVISGEAAGGESAPEVDLSQPVSIVVADPPPGAATLQMNLSVGGLPIGSSNEVPVVAAVGSVSATVSASSPRIVASGPVDAELLLRDVSGAPLPSPTVEIDPDRQVWLSVGGWLAIVLTALVVVYAASLSTPLRRGRRRIRSTVALAGVGAVGGATAVLWAWCLGGPQPAVTSLVVAAVLGAIVGAATASSLFLLGRRRRVRRRIRARARARADAAR